MGLGEAEDLLHACWEASTSMQLLSHPGQGSAMSW